MKIIVQRVLNAKVYKQETNEIVGEIDGGLFILLGIKKGDTKASVDYLVEKVSKLRVMSDKNKKMNLSVKETTNKVLVVSQFTLYANTKDGNRPSFVDAEIPEKARGLYEYFVQSIKNRGILVETGSFGNYMRIETVLDGPVTIVVES